MAEQKPTLIVDRLAATAAEELTERVDMTNWTRRRARLATVAGLAAVIAVAFAVPASAAAGNTSSYGVKCAGLVTCGPFAQSAYPAGPASNTLASVNVAGLITTGLINTAATSSGASSSVATVNAPLATGSTLTADAVSSQCSVNPTTGGVSGSSSITNGSISVLGSQPITLATSPAPNTTVAGLTGIATVILNRQTTAQDGTLTVDAIYIQLLNGQEITIASSSCTPGQGNTVPMASGAGLALGGGLLGMLVLGYAFRRRSSLARQAA